MIISTFDSSYSHPSLSKRVASGDISVMRLRDNEVELKIAEVKALDAGFYWCQTPSTDSVISGNYEARVQLTGKGGVCVCQCACIVIFKPLLWVHISWLIFIVFWLGLGILLWWLRDREWLMSMIKAHVNNQRKTSLLMKNRIWYHILTFEASVEG